MWITLFFIIINFQFEIKKNKNKNKPQLIFFSDAVMVIILLLTGLNSCVNPWIFLAFSGRMCSKTQLTSRQSGYTCTTGTESDGRYRSSSVYDGNSSIVKFGHVRNSNHMILRNSRFWICQELFTFYLSVYKKIKFISKLYELTFESDHMADGVPFIELTVVINNDVCHFNFI